MNIIVPQVGATLWSISKDCNALYLCPKLEGRRIGPLVPYAGTYTGADGQKRNFVGDIYFNFRRIEANPLAVDCFAEEAYKKLKGQGLLIAFDTVCGIPEGGRTFAQALARKCGKRFVYATKKPKPKEEGKKQEYDWDLSQFEFTPDEHLAVAEDVFNNFQNTKNTLLQVGATGAKVVLLVGALNRSAFVNEAYTPNGDAFGEQSLPVVCAIREPYPEYEQDDPAVAEDISKGNIEWEVKKNWAKLMAAMAKIQ